MSEDVRWTESATVNEALNPFMRLFQIDFVHSWYLQLSPDAEFSARLQQRLALVSRSLEKRFKRV